LDSNGVLDSNAAFKNNGALDKNMLQRLYVKLSLTLLALFFLVGAAMLVLTRYAMDMYFQEITQRLNAPVAMYITNETPLIEQGVANTAALKSLAHHAMIINPSIEVYLLDSNGRIISHALGDKVQRQRVDLAPLQQFFSNDKTLPLTGDDPLHRDSKKIFTAAKVTSSHGLEGYVYVILGGDKYETLASSLNHSYVLRFSVLAVLALLLFGRGTALLIFARLSRPLAALTRKADQFQRDVDAPAGVAVDGDEIRRLDIAFDAMRNRINQQLDQIRQANDMRRELITNISHDLRTPLTAMLGYVETLLLKQRELSDQQRHEYLEVTRNHGQRLGRLIGDLFELTKLDSNAVHPQIEAFSIAELAQDIVQDFRLTADTKHITLTVEGRLHDAQVLADIHLIERVLENLLENALRHTPQHGNIVINIERQDKLVGVTVRDTGGGIAEADLPHIFERFFHAKETQVQELKSTGLGLAIVKRILDLHFSSISVDSAPSQGTSFTFALPASA